MWYCCILRLCVLAAPVWSVSMYRFRRYRWQWEESSVRRYFYWQYRWCVKTSWHWIRRKITDLWFWQVLWWQSTGLVSFNRSRHRPWQSGPLHFQLSHCFWHFWNLYYSMRRYAVRIFWMLWSFWWEYWSRFRNFQWRIKWRLEFSGECWQVLLMQ